MSLQIGKVIYDILSTDTAITSKVGSRIFPLIAENGTMFPFIVYKRNSIEPSTSKDRFIYSESIIIEIAIAATKYNESIEIAEAVRETLEGKKGRYKNIVISKIEMVDANEDFIEDTFIQTITFKIQTQNG